MKKCPFCGESVEDNLTACVFCGKSLVFESKVKLQWYHKRGAMIMGFLILPPLILPAIWTHPTYSKNKKIIITVAIVLITYFLVAGTVKAVNGVKDYYKLLNQTMTGF